VNRASLFGEKSKTRAVQTGVLSYCGECAEPRLAQKQESKEKEAEEKKEKNITKEVEDNVSLQSE